MADELNRLYDVKKRLYEFSNSLGSAKLSDIAADLDRGIAEAETVIRELRQVLHSADLESGPGHATGSQVD